MSQELISAAKDWITRATTFDCRLTHNFVNQFYTVDMYVINAFYNKMFLLGININKHK